jgi:prepilin-type N-terminal cleavage/methylation domain-containing protein
MTHRNRSSKGFSLLEMVIVLAILMTVMGAVFQQIATVQKTSRTEEMKLDLTQEGREFVDQFVRDLHQAGYPNAGLFAPGVLVATADNDSKNAVGLVKFAYDEVWLEADVNGDGAVDSINYKLQTASGSGQCPCKISRGWVPKDIGNSTSPWSQTANTSAAYTVELQDLANSGGANGGTSGSAAYTIYGTSNGISNDTMYAAYKNANVFTAYDVAGNEVAPADYSTSSGKAALATIKNIRINLNLLARQGDPQTGKRPVITFSSAARVGNN